MDPEKLAAAIAALEAGDGDAGLAILKEMVIALAAAGAGAEAAEPAAASTELATTETPDPAAPAPGAAVVEEAARNLLLSLTGAKDLAQLRSVFGSVTTLDTQRRTLDLAERRELIGKLVVLECETLATAWEGDPEKRTPSKRLMGEAIESLRDRVGQLETLRGGSTTETRRLVPPVGSAQPGQLEIVKGDVKSLSADDQAYCKKNSVDPQDFADRKAQSVRRVTRAPQTA